MIGNYLGPDEAFRFALGATVTASAGQCAKLIRPLDFLVVADHSEKLGPGALDRRVQCRPLVHLVKSGDGYFAEEVLYREAQKLGLDQDDVVIRRRMRQKMQSLLQDGLALAPPDEAALRASYEAEQQRYREPDRQLESA